MSVTTHPPLSERDAQILTFEREWWKHAGNKEEAIREHFDLSPTRYYQLLNRIIDDEVALAHDPMLVKRLRRLRAQRQRQRAARREKLAELIGFGEELAAKLDRQDEGASARGRRATDRGAFARFHRRVLEAQMSRFLSIDFEAERFRFDENTAAIERAEALDGKLVLLSNVEDLPAAEIVERYRALADIERGFRVLKSDIEIAPVYHRLPDRIRAHALICFLALLLHRIMRSRLKAAGSPLSPQRALATLRQIQRHRVAIGGRPLERTGRLGGEQLQLFRDLGLEGPAEAV